MEGSSFFIGHYGEMELVCSEGGRPLVVNAVYVSSGDGTIGFPSVLQGGVLGCENGTGKIVSI